MRFKILEKYVHFKIILHNGTKVFVQEEFGNKILFRGNIFYIYRDDPGRGRKWHMCDGYTGARWATGRYQYELPDMAKKLMDTFDAPTMDEAQRKYHLGKAAKMINDIKKSGISLPLNKDWNNKIINMALNEMEAGRDDGDTYGKK